MSEPTDAELIEWLRLRSTDDADLGFDDEAIKLELAAQRLESRPSTSGQEISEARPLEEYHEDMGPVLWWSFPVKEAPYVGSPLDTGRAVEMTIRDSVRDYTYTEHIGGWPGYHTHFTPLPPIPRAALSEKEG